MAAAHDDEFTAFASARWQALRRFAFLLTGDLGEAEDLVQVALAKTYVAWPRIRSGRATESYTRTCLSRAYLAQRRKRRIREVPVAVLPEVAADGDGVGEDTLWCQLRLLPARQRAVLVLRYYEGLNEREIAQTLGCAPGTVKSQASKGLAKLRQILSVESTT
jgi:RNA polymerase sigma-70 factor (sigma-E family)